MSAATWTASGQPARWTFGNGRVQEWSYSSPVPRLSRMTLGTSFVRSYGYDWANNIERITDEVSGQVQQFRYDEWNRLVHAWTEGGSTGYAEQVSYDGAGNITSKGGVSYWYGWQSGSCPNGAMWKPHAVRVAGATSYCYDANGNMVRRGNEHLSWNGLGQLTRVNGVGVLEDYGYDGDGARVSVTANGQTTISLEGGLWEEVVGGAQRSYVQFGGQVVAVRDHSAGTITYLHGDHLGSVSLATNASGAVVSQQEFDPWGKLRSGGVSQTKRNYTGQILDSTGLLFYNARYYDPSIGRFISADTIVPGNAAGGMDGIAVKPLTVDFHEGGFQSRLNQENRLGFWFQLSDQQRSQAGSPWGPANPQALNRYSYVQNNPLKYTDPSGHTLYLDAGQSRRLVQGLKTYAGSTALMGTLIGLTDLSLGAVAAKIAAMTPELAGDATLIATIMLPALLTGGLTMGLFAYELNWFADQIAYHTGESGVAIATDEGGVYFLNRSTGEANYWRVHWWDRVGKSIYDNLPASLKLGNPTGDPSWWTGWHFTQDEQNLDPCVKYTCG